ncbi:FAD-binding dehydrogenase [Thalassotalea agarivorans]|uniref:FAD-dependent oxidoreductase 2 FAD-binding domain-containing protein n=1 Tax=Thalassotalea agarivorans TaxID=349064 RepID=A0A1I0FHT2_THASX|nr:FAD-binding dehydrogenase [Thalassotalea agarivorans]SET57868.1 hypothetical protein SAMN05660429_02147 [Thalassotalea agarivorans]
MKKKDVVIAGGGIAGLVTALELVKHADNIVIVDRDTPERIGGLARWAFGGMALCETAEQKRAKIADSPKNLLNDIHSFADFNADDHWPKQWANAYAQENKSLVYDWLKGLGMSFLPAVNWVERGLHTPGNSLPRYHVLWGTGWNLVETVWQQLKPYIDNGKVEVLYQHKVIRPLIDDNTVVGVEVENEQSNDTFTIDTSYVVIACGGINGATEQVKKNWYKPWGKPPETMLNGANPISDGKLHEAVEAVGGAVTHQDKMWNYAAGVRHPQAEFDGHGLSLIPCKSALWLNHSGQRIGPDPLVTGFDTNFLCKRVSEQEKPWTWQILNKKIALKEFAVSGSLHNPSIRDKKLFSFLKEILFGNHRLINQMLDECDDFIAADTVEALADKMNGLTDQDYISADKLQHVLDSYDQQFNEGFFEDDDQVRRIRHARQWKADKLRTCKPGAIQDQKSGPFIAIKLQLISRKSLGGIKTDLDSQVLNQQEQKITGLYAVGEAAGFGGGGMNGFRSLEGTFLSACIITAKHCAKAILNAKQ